MLQSSNSDAGIESPALEASVVISLGATRESCLGIGVSGGFEMRVKVNTVLLQGRLRT